ncbi:MAG: molybdate ABC transporter permease subunit [Nitrospinae bacterium]|nr:molybdate ABC transporter permease subunit [Nitrospinota bacterium]MBI3815504.1 molybdate ABC transporter permease subunit [Nitrospinota bacterium]
MNWEPIILTAKLASVVSVILVIIGVPIAYWISFSKWRWKFLIEAVVALPLVLPPTVLGFYILVAISPNNLIGRLWVELFGATLPFSFSGLVIASVFYSLPFAVQPFASSFETVDRRLIEAAWTLGSSKVKTFFTIIIPLSVSGIITGIVLSFAHTLGEFGVVLMVGGNIPGVTRTVSIDIYDNVQALKYSEAASTAFFLLIVSFLILSIVYAVNRKVWSVWPQRF